MGLIHKLGALFDKAPDAPSPAAPVPKGGDTVPKGGTAAPKPEFIWQLLDAPSGTHLHFLDPDYAPVGLIDLMVREPRLVLDVGCYCGATGALIKERWPAARVVGIEPLSGAAEIATGRIDHVINSTLQDVSFDEIGIAPNSVDVIVFADVLEHMYNPWSALKLARGLLADDGVVLASIPNVRNLGLISNLVNGRWKYEGAGLLDITHIRFFSLAEVKDMFAQTGFRVDMIAHGIDPPFSQLAQMEPEKDRVNLQFDSLVINNASRADRMELATRQFFVRANKAT